MNLKFWPGANKREIKAYIRGGPLAPSIRGIVRFKDDYKT